MSGHADTIRRALEDFDLEVPQGRDATLSTDALAALDALLVEQADRIAWLEGDVAQRRIKNQRLRDALGRIVKTPYRDWHLNAQIAREALDGTPSEDA